jgi:hypothetical protein
MQTKVWAVTFRDHIHVNVRKQLSVFDTQEHAERWIRLHGMWDCGIQEITLDRDNFKHVGGHNAFGGNKVERGDVA